MKMKNGNLKIILSMLALGYLVGASASISKKRINKMSYSKSDQYINRLKEFFFDDYPKAIKRYSQYVQSGLSPEAAFDIIVGSMQLSTLTIGEMND